MARPIFAVLFLLLVQMETTVGFLHLNIKPTNVSPGLTQSLIVNCTFTFNHISNISGLISLIVSKSELDQNHKEQPGVEELVSLNIFSPDQVNVHSQINGSVSGHIDGDGESYLTIQWTYPGNDQAGLYRCEAHGMDSTGYPSEVVKTAMVTSEQPDMGQLINKVSHLQSQLVSQKNLTNHLVSQLDRQQEIERNQSQNINYLTSQLDRQEKIIDTLLSLTKNQSHMINKQQSQVNIMQAQMDVFRNAFYDFNVSGIYKDHVYLLSKADWNNAIVAEQTCKDHNGYLAQIDDSGEDAFINQFLDSTSGFDIILVSGTDEGHDGQWKYTGTDLDMTYINWRAGEPGWLDLNCMEKYRGNQWQFADYPCISTYTPKKFLCEVNLQ